MKNYIVHNADGDILRSGCCNEADFDLQAGNNEFVIEGIADDDNKKIVDGQIVDKVKTDSELQQEALRELRKQRNAMLQASDWTQIPDAPLTTAQKKSYKTYRQALRDLPTKYDSITNINQVVFPQIEV